MSLIKVWPYVIITVLVVPVISLEKVDPMEQTQNISKRAVEALEERPFFAGGVAPNNIPDVTREAIVIVHKVQTANANVKQTCFVSLFDESRNIPFYSAYKVTSEQAALIGTIASGSNPNWRRPAINKAYKQMIKLEPTITRGHLNPAALNSFDVRFRTATFTLTNAAPMFEAMNNGAWAKYEERIRQYAKCPCGSVRKGTLYLLTGTSNYGIKKRIGTEEIVQVTDADPTFQTRQLPTGKSGKTTNLQIPRAIWTAGCCVWEEVKKVFGSTQYVTRAESFAVMCNNEKVPDNVLLAEMSVPKVEVLLTDPRKGRVNLFPNFPVCRLPANPDFKLPL